MCIKGEKSELVTTIVEVIWQSLSKKDRRRDFTKEALEESVVIFVNQLSVKRLPNQDEIEILYQRMDALRKRQQRWHNGYYERRIPDVKPSLNGGTVFVADQYGITNPSPDNEVSFYIDYENCLSKLPEHYQAQIHMIVQGYTPAERRVVNGLDETADRNLANHAREAFRRRWGEG